MGAHVIAAPTATAPPLRSRGHRPTSSVVSGHLLVCHDKDPSSPMAGRRTTTPSRTPPTNPTSSTRRRPPGHAPSARWRIARRRRGGRCSPQQLPRRLVSASRRERAQPPQCHGAQSAHVLQQVGTEEQRVVGPEPLSHLVATGRRIDLTGLGVDTVGLDATAPMLTVDDHMRAAKKSGVPLGPPLSR